ncbi:MAG: hypothetical protein NVS4B2_12310 [Chloroflexota bacterium]
MVVEQVLPGIDTALAADFETTVELLQRSTVQVRTNGMGAGSGVIWRSDGLIITNAHVARGPGAVVELADGRTFDAEIVGRDGQRDLAALQIRADDLPAATVLDSDTLRVGQLVVAVGNPLGMVGAMTMGIIHSIAPAEGRGRGAWIQADVSLLPGNSGGPLADAGGRVVGINSMVAGELGLAVPSNAVQRFLGYGGQRPQLGVVMQPVLVPVNGQRVGGMLVLEVTPDSSAEAAGMMVGDILTGVEGRSLQDPRDLLLALEPLGTGGTLTLDLLRGGVRQSRRVVIAPVTEKGRTGAAA